MSDEQVSNAPDQSIYSPEELQQAAETIKSLTPEAYLEMLALIRSTDVQAILPEAGGYAFTDLYAPDGAVVKVGARSYHPIPAFKELMVSVEYCKRHSNLKSVPDTAPTNTPSAASVAQPASTAVAPTTAPQKAPESSHVASPPREEPVYESVGEGQGSVSEQKLTVSLISKALTQGGNPYLLIKTREPQYAKYGIKAWPEVLPQELAFDAMQPGIEAKPIDSMRFAFYDTQTKKVKSFSAT
jgi:hypothetical protein